MFALLFQTLAKFRDVGALVALLWLVQTVSPITVVFLALVLFLVGLFTLVTGWGLPRLKGRWKGLGVLLASQFFLHSGLMVLEREEQQVRWAELRVSDPDAYLAEVALANHGLWLEELRDLRPGAYQAELERRERAAQETAALRAAEAEARQRAAEVAAAQRAAEAAEREARRTAEAQERAAAAARREEERARTRDGTRFVESDFYWDSDTTRYRAEIVTVVNRIAQQHARCRDPDPETVMLSSTRSRPGAPVFFVICGRGLNAFNVWFSPEDARTERAFQAIQHVNETVAVMACENAARASATHPSTVRFSRVRHLSFTTYNSGRARVVSRFTARNGFNLELAYTIDCLFEGNSMMEVNISESAS